MEIKKEFTIYGEKTFKLVFSLGFKGNDLSLKYLHEKGEILQERMKPVIKKLMKQGFISKEALVPSIWDARVFFENKS